MQTTIGKIHLGNLRRNIRLIKKHVKSRSKICMALKADGYGHGAVAAAEIALSEGLSSFGVARIEEGIELRDAGIRADILMFSLPVPEDIPELTAYSVSPFVADPETVRLINDEAQKQQKVVSVHLKIDTGMGRIGCTPEKAPSLAEQIDRCRYLELGGTCTHFPCSDSGDKTPTLQSLALFMKTVSEIRNRGINPGILHTANSGAIIDYPETHLDMVRPGIILYGYYPSDKQERILPVRPVFELETKVVFLKKVPAGTPVSYGSTYRPEKSTYIATLPVGYGDGYPRLLSNRGKVLIKGKLYPIAGRICMDQCMVDLGPRTDVRLYERAVLFGADTTGPTAETVAEIIGTIPYEITCGINKRVPRIYIP